jgi:hypothetical protein
MNRSNSTASRFLGARRKSWMQAFGASMPRVNPPQRNYPTPPTCASDVDNVTGPISPRLDVPATYSNDISGTLPVESNLPQPPRNSSAPPVVDTGLACGPRNGDGPGRESRGGGLLPGLPGQRSGVLGILEGGCQSGRAAGRLRRRPQPASTGMVQYTRPGIPQPAQKTE